MIAQGVLKVRAEASNAGRLEGVTLICGGADNHYGVFVAADGGIPSGWASMEQIASDIWLVDEVPGLRY
jgi:hypothetical protein